MCYLLEDEERREGSGDVQFDQIQTGFSVCHRRSLCREQTGSIRRQPGGRRRGGVLPLSLSLTELVSL